MKYLLTGAQGTGKTSIMDALPSSYNKIQCVTRKCITENNLRFNNDSDNHSQKCIFDAYERQLTSLDNYIAERSLIDVYAYTLHQVKNGKCSPTLAETQLSHIQKFIHNNPDAVYFYVPIEFEIQQDGIRSIDKQFQQEIDKQIRSTLIHEGCHFFTVTGTVEERVKFIEYVVNKTK